MGALLRDEPESPLTCIAAEQELLGAILLNNEALDVVANIVSADDFSEAIHGLLFSAFAAARNDGRTITTTLAAAALEAGGAEKLSDDMTVAQYIARLAAAATTVVNAPDFAKTIREYADRRKISRLADSMKAGARIMATGPEAVAIDTVAELDEIAARYSASHSRSVGLGRAAELSVNRMAAAMENQGRITGITTGLRDLDAKTNGLQRGDFIVLAGRPGIGKSGLAISMLRQSGANALLFSLEMNAEGVADRILSDMAFDQRGEPVPYFDIARGSLSMSDGERILDLQRALAGSRKIEIDPQSGLTVGQIGSRARRYKQALERQGKTLDLVCVDHMHIVRPSSRYAGNRTGELTEISGGLKSLAKELNVPVLALAQLSRKVEERDNKRPQMSDLRDSGSIEQDADVIGLIYREAYYLEKTRYDDPGKEELRVARLAQVRRELEANIAKQRNGPTGVVQLFFDPASNAARNWGQA